jgi:D-tyrosyl-tRNA(Tyr) deacylase
MLALLQRVCEASVTVDGAVIGQIDKGLMVLVCAEKGDTEDQARKLAQKLLRYRVFSDENGKMNRSVKDVAGDVLLVSQFTLAADTNSGNRPSFTPAAAPETGRRLYEVFVDEVRLSGLKTQTGRFGADMKVALINDGPVTFLLKA